MLRVVLLRDESLTAVALSPFGSEDFSFYVHPITETVVGESDPWVLRQRLFRKSPRQRYAKHDCVHTQAFATLALNAAKGVHYHSTRFGQLVDDETSGGIYFYCKSNISYGRSYYDRTLGEGVSNIYVHASKDVSLEDDIREEMGWKENVQVVQSVVSLYSRRVRSGRAFQGSFGYRVYATGGGILLQQGPTIQRELSGDEGRDTSQIEGDHRSFLDTKAYTNLYHYPIFYPDTTDITVAGDMNYELTDGVDTLTYENGQPTLKPELLEALTNYLKSVSPPFLELDDNDIFYRMLERFQPPKTNWGEYTVGLAELGPTLRDLVKSVRLK